MRTEVLLGVERRRRWKDQAKLAILGEVGVNGWTVADVARRHDVTRQHIYQWRGEMRRKGLWPAADAALFLPMEMGAAPEVAAEPGGASAEITVVLCNGRQLRCSDGIGGAALVRLVRSRAAPRRVGQLRGGALLRVRERSRRRGGISTRPLGRTGARSFGRVCDGRWGPGR